MAPVGISFQCALSARQTSERAEGSGIPGTWHAPPPPPLPQRAQRGRRAPPTVGKWRCQPVQTRQQPVITEVRSPFPMTVSFFGEC